jgi:uncharacterized protein YjiS (DUF1127 family)
MDDQSVLNAAAVLAGMQMRSYQSTHRRAWARLLCRSLMFPIWLVKRGSRTIRVWRRRSRDREELASLDMRTLRDVGISGYDVKWEASKPFWKE